MNAAEILMVRQAGCQGSDGRTRQDCVCLGPCFSVWPVLNGSADLSGSAVPLLLQGRLPVKWMAPEALFDRVYTHQSDV